VGMFGRLGVGAGAATCVWPFARGWEFEGVGDGGIDGCRESSGYD